MKTAWIFFIGSLSLFAFGVADAKEERHSREDRGAHSSRHDGHKSHSKRHHSGHSRHSSKHHSAHHRGSKHSRRAHRYDHHKRKHRHKRRHRTEHFLGGVVVGALAHHAISGHYDSCPDEYHTHNTRRYYWENRRGECFLVEEGRRGKVYKEVSWRQCRAW